MAQFVARWFTPPSKKTPSQQQAAQRPSVTPGKRGIGRAKKRTQTRFGGVSRRADEADTARKTLLGE